MIRHHSPRPSLVAIGLLAALLLTAGSALAQDGGVIQGTVYVDMNANLVRDAGEPAYVGAEIIVANGQTGWQLLTGGDGVFRVDVPNGNWQVALMVPQGFAPANDATREVAISPESGLSATLDFALLSMATGGAGQDGQAPTATPPPTATVPAVLPQTGAPVAPAAAMSLGLVGLLMAGLVLWGLGRWAASRA
jgi:hypothetical protein